LPKNKIEKTAFSLTEDLLFSVFVTIFADLLSCGMHFYNSLYYQVVRCCNAGRSVWLAEIAAERRNGERTARSEAARQSLWYCQHGMSSLSSWHNLLQL